MRPRPIRRGNTMETDSLPGVMSRFNEAATNSSRKQEVRVLLFLYGVASMRPRPIRRGNGRFRERQAHVFEVASMRPRPIRRGNAGRAFVARHRGNCFNEAAT